MSAAKYKVNEIFRSVQAEGANSGRQAVFVRFSGCNLKCKFCDTAHETGKEMAGEEIESEIEKLSGGDKSILVVFTGGEPCMQLKEEEPLGKGRRTAVETNGTLPVPGWIDWVTVSPKTKLAPEALKRANEIKVLCGTFGEESMKSMEGLHCALYLQPMEKNGDMNVKECTEFLKSHPAWRLSVQWHKLIGVR